MQFLIRIFELNSINNLKFDYENIKLNYLSFSSIFLSCEDVQFKHAQPIDVKSMNKIPESFLGSYINDDSYLIVNEKSFSFVNVLEKEEYSGELNKTAELKFFEGHYFCSLKTAHTNLWRIAMVSLDNKTLSLFSIIDSDRVDILKQNINYQKKTTTDGLFDYLEINPNKVEFKNFVDNDYFTLHQSFTKISSSIKSKEEMTAMVQKKIDESNSKEK